MYQPYPAVPQYGYSGKPGGGIVKAGDEAWLDQLDKFRVVGGGCCGDVTLESGSVRVRMKKQGTGCSNTYHAYVGGELVAIFGRMPGACGYGSRYVQCPPGQEVMSAVIRKEGYGKHAPTFYFSHFRAGDGAGGSVHIRYRLNQHCMMGKMPICDAMGRIIADYEPPTCTCGCGDVGNIRFSRDATPTDKLGAIDVCMASVDFSCANPCRWTICLVFLLPLLLFAVMGSFSAIMNNDKMTTTTSAPTMAP